MKEAMKKNEMKRKTIFIIYILTWDTKITYLSPDNLLK